MGARVLIGFSGGSDSTALLHLLVVLREERQLELYAAHFDHGLRAGSAEEAMRAVEVCAAVGLPCATERASGLRRSQAACRDARYRFLRSEADRLQVARIALAHQRDDHIETVLFRLIRGTGLRGLAGIPPRRGRIVRPLLGFGRSELRDYARSVGADWARDPANRDARYARARVRHALLPALDAASGGDVRRSILELSGGAALADAGLERRAEALAEVARLEAPNGAQIARSVLLGYDRADRARIVRKLARDLGFRLTRRGTAAAVEFIRRGPSGHGIDVAAGLRVSREYDRILLTVPSARERDQELEIDGPGPGSGRLRLGGREYRVSWRREPGAAAPDAGRVVRLPLRELAFPLRLRGPRPGDRIRTTAGSRKLKKLLNERRVPASERAAVPVLASAEGCVLWVVGHAEAAGDRPLPSEERFTIAVGED